MCIVCRCGELTAKDGKGAIHYPADTFLNEFAAATHHMRAAAEALRLCAASHRPYDHAHKRMVQLIRDWNAIEHGREKEDGEHWTGHKTPDRDPT